MEKGQTFPEFVLTCARAMGACIMMRDDAMDAPIPERFEPSDYHKKRIAEATKENARLLKMGNAEKIAFGKAKKAERIARCKEWLARERAEMKRLADMEKAVRKWTPPTPDHVGLKEFMLQQIDVSKHDLDYIERDLAKAKASAPMDYYVDAVNAAERDMEYNVKHEAEEVERAENRNKWLQDLRSSIGARAGAGRSALPGQHERTPRSSSRAKRPNEKLTGGTGSAQSETPKP
jgi:hypothetical protein